MNGEAVNTGAGPVGEAVCASATTITICFDASSETVQTHIQAAPGSDPATVLETAMAALEAERSALDGCPIHDKASIGIIQRTRDRIKAIIAEYGRRVPIPVGLTHDVLSTFDHMARGMLPASTTNAGAGSVGEAVALLDPDNRKGPPQPLMHPNAEWCEAYARWFHSAVRFTLSAARPVEEPGEVERAKGEVAVLSSLLKIANDGRDAAEAALAETRVERDSWKEQYHAAANTAATYADFWDRHHADEAPQTDGGFLTKGERAEIAKLAEATALRPELAETQERLEKELRRAGFALDEALTAINPETDEVTYARVKKWADRARTAADEAGE